MKILPNTQRLGKLTFDSNQVRKSKTNPNVLVAKASDGKDYGVVRKSDGSYDYAGSSRNNSFGDRMATASANPNIANRILETAGLLASEPQRMMTRKLTNNRYNNPEEVVADSKLPDGMLKNTLGFAAGMVADPSNLIGIGAGAKAAKLAMMLPAIPGLNKLFKSSKVMSKIDDAIQPFKSEINWSKWNKEIPDNTQLMKEYDTIEQTSKANNTWMKNPDGSVFQGTPEQFVQQNSENFKKAFPEGFDKTYRGVSNFFNTNKLNEPLFTGDISNAKYYASANNPGFWNVNKNIIKEASKFTDPIPQSLEHLNMVREASKTGDWSKVRAIEYNDVLNSNAGGVHSFYSPKSKNNITIDAKGKEWTNIPYEGREMPTDFVAEDLFNKNLDYININNVRDPRIGDLKIINPNRINAKSAIGNNGMFDMNNPNIYKGIVPGAIAAGAAASTMSNKDKNNKFKYGGKLLPLLNKF